MEEIWMPLSRFGGLIEVSNLGGVRKPARSVNCRGGHKRIMPAAAIKFRRHPFGYYWCEFMVHRVQYRDFVHRLVAEAFIGPCPKGHYVLHGDGDPKNNRVDNLRYGTPSENCADKLLHGTQPHGERIWWSKRAEPQVVEIREKRAAGARITDLARKYGLSESAVWTITTGKRWRHVGGPITPKERRVNILSDDDRKKVIAIRNSEGLSLERIATMFDVSVTQVHRIVRQHEAEKSNPA